MKLEYVVKPRIPIRSLPEEGPIVRPKILKLQKEQVLLCLKCGPVYRRFSDTEQVKVTAENLDSLHVTRLQYNGTIAKIMPHPINDTTLVSNANTKEIPQEPKKEEAIVKFGDPIKTKEEVPVEEPAKVEEVVEDTTESKEENVEIVKEPVQDEPVEVSEETEKVVEEEKEETPSEETDEDAEAPVEGNSNNNNQHRNKKKHH